LDKISDEWLQIPALFFFREVTDCWQLEESKEQVMLSSPIAGLIGYNDFEENC
jgi:hypothetical protein